MAADDELPRGWTQFASGTAANAVVTFPAIPGISWVVTSVKCAASSGYAGGYFLNVQDQNADVFGEDGGNAGAAGEAIASMEWDGQNPYPISTAVTITAYETGSLNTNLNVTAYPI